MSVAFSSSSEDCIETKIALPPQLVPSGEDETRIWDDFHDYFEIEKVAEWIRTNAYQRVALQLPDHLLKFAVKIVRVVEEKVGSDQLRIFVLGDTSYGSCCVDEVAAKHGLASAVVHFGPSCLSPPSSLPVLFVFGKEQVDVDDLINQCVSAFPASIDLLFLFDPLYSHAENVFEQKLKSRFVNSILGRTLVPSLVSGADDSPSLVSPIDVNVDVGDDDDERKKDEGRERRLVAEICRRNVQFPEGKKLQDYKIVYVGMEGPALNNLILHFQNEFYTYDPKRKTLRKESVNVNKTFLKRYYLIEKVKDANIIGILAGTLGVANYLDIIKRLKDLIKSAGKKSYTFVVGKLNVPKLANFQEIEAYVLVACPENSLIDSREFFQPVLTPFELEVALNPSREWEPKIVTDFRKLLPGESDCIDFEGFTSEERNDVSLITGKLRQIGREEDVARVNDEKSLVKRDDGMVVANIHTGAGYLQNRSWKGLEQNLGQTQVKKASEGQRGIAMGYENETERT